MKFSRIAAALLATISSGALAGGPLYIHEPTMKPYKWDTSKGPIPVYTDGGPVIMDAHGNPVKSFSVLEKGTTFNLDITLPDGSVLPKYTTLDRDYTFLTVDQADAVTANAIHQWSAVETSTFEMTIQGTIEEKAGIADVNGSNAEQIIYAENGYGFWVNYDTDGQILEQYFGVPRDQVLGIAFPEWADEATGEIVEATATMSGWYVSVEDTDGAMVNGVFTHEFGHAINMSHSQANGQIAYFARGYQPMYDGVPGCEGTTKYTSSANLPLSSVETMFPFINVLGEGGREQASVNVRDDIVNISDLYPTADYLSSTGTISGTLYTKNGIEYSGINMVARNLDNPLYDVITQQSGNQTQGLIGPDGKFTIHGLTPGGRYALYMERIVAGGYPTTPTAILSEAEYWNEDESSNPATDDACAITPIVAQAGVTQQVDMYFNGYQDGIKYTPLVQAYVQDHAKNGQRALGTTQGGSIFLYDSTKKVPFVTIANAAGYAMLQAANPAMDKTATKAAGVADFNGDGVATPAVWDIRSNKITPLPDPSNGTCTIDSDGGKSSASVWDISDDGKVIAGTVRKPRNSDELICAEGAGGASDGLPVLWRNGQLEYLDLTGLRNVPWVRADRIAGNGTTVTGMMNGNGQVAWVNGKFRDIDAEFGATDGSVISSDGRYVAFGALDLTVRGRPSKGVQVWDTYTDQLRDLGGLRWCDDIQAYNAIGINYCDRGYDHDSLVANGVGLPRVTLMDANDDLTMMTARAGSILSGGFTGAIYVEGLGWMTTGEFFGKQGVVEASQSVMDNPFGLSADGSKLFGGWAGAAITFDVNMDKAYVCDNGVNKELSFPKQVVAAVKKGAEFGRCEHLNDRY